MTSSPQKTQKSAGQQPSGLRPVMAAETRLPHPRCPEVGGKRAWSKHIFNCTFQVL